MFATIEMPPMPPSMMLIIVLFIPHIPLARTEAIRSGFLLIYVPSTFLVEDLASSSLGIHHSLKKMLHCNVSILIARLDLLKRRLLQWIHVSRVGCKTVLESGDR